MQKMFESSTRIGHDVIYSFYYLEDGDEGELYKHKVDSQELCEFIEDEDLADYQVGVDKFRKDDTWDFLMQNWDEVVEKYWDEVV